MEVEELKFWIHPEGWLYTGDQIEGARAATNEEVTNHLNSNAKLLT